jgi:predicted RNA-binding Zn-ribbon protein involved in translation (DUF1610 family)
MGETALGRYPTSLIEFQAAFGTEAACAAYLAEQRWPNGFVCPACGSLRAWTLKTKAHTYECADCGRQTSVTAGTILHDSKLPLTTWFLAAFLMATHSNGLSARQLQSMLAGWARPTNRSHGILAPNRTLRQSRPVAHRHAVAALSARIDTFSASDFCTALRPPCDVLSPDGHDADLLG